MKFEKPKKIPTSQELEKMIEELMSFIPLTRDEIIGKAVSNYYHRKRDTWEAKVKGNWVKIRHFLLEEQKHECYYCKKLIAYSSSSLDHKQPKARGGTYDLENLCATCHDCNNEKGNMTEEEYGIYRQEQQNTKNGLLIKREG